MNWIALAILGLVLSFLGSLSFRLYRERKRGQKLGDKDALRESLADWEHLVLEHEKTMRGVKRFANRARFLLNDVPDQVIPRLVGLVALDEIGLMDHPLDRVEDESDLENWKLKVSRNVVISGSNPGPDIVKRWLDTVTPLDWNRYQALATLGRLPNGD